MGRIAAAAFLRSFHDTYFTQGDSKIANGSHVVTVSNRTSHADGCAAAAAAPWINFPSHGRITRRWPSLFRDDGCFHAIIDPERRPSCVSVAFCLRPVKS